MVQEAVLLFADVRIDLASECVWRGEQALKFTPTAFALLHYLAAHPGRLITKNELLEALWPETAVTEGVLTTHVRQIRQALGDEAKVPGTLRRCTGAATALSPPSPLLPSQFKVQRSRFKVQSPNQHPTPNVLHPLWWAERQKSCNYTDG